MSEQKQERPAGQLDPWVGDFDDPASIADFEGEAEYAAREDEERRREGNPRVPLASEVLGPPPAP